MDSTFRKLLFMLCFSVLLQEPVTYAQEKLKLEELPYYLKDSIGLKALPLCELGLYLIRFNIRREKIVNVHFSQRILPSVGNTIRKGIENILVDCDGRKEDQIYVIPLFIAMKACGRQEGLTYLQQADTLPVIRSDPGIDAVRDKVRAYRQENPVLERLFQTSNSLWDFDDGSVLGNKDCFMLNTIYLETALSDGEFFGE